MTQSTNYISNESEAEIDDVNVRDLISDTDYSFNQSFYKEDDFIG